MQKLLFLLTLAFAPFFLFAEDTPIRVMTYNLRYDNSSIFSWDPNRWALRKDPIAGVIKSYDPDILGIQEGFSWQVADLVQRLPQWAWHGIGRTDGKQEGEFAAIFFKKDKFDLLQKGTFWLSQTPGKPSKGWDASDYRVASWAILRDKNTKQPIFILNTHLDHKGRVARIESMKLILNQLKNLAKGMPVIITGDFNTTLTQSMTSSPYIPIGEDPSAKLGDAFTLTLNSPEGPSGTFLGSGEFSTKAPVLGRIDFIFVNRRVEVLTYRVLTDSKEGHYFSDHLPVLIEGSIAEEKN